MASRATKGLESVASKVSRKINSAIEGEAHRKLFQLIDVEPRKEYVAFRIPDGVEVFDDLWMEIKQICAKNNIKCKRIGKYSTAQEYGEFLSAIEWLWHNWIPIGFLTLLVGDPGSGKSMVALDWVKTVTEGTCWPLCTKNCPANQRLCKPRDVVWVEAEAGQKILYDRMLSLGIQLDKVFIPPFGGDLMGQPDLSNENHREQLRELIKAKKPRLIIVDSLGGINTAGENRVEDVRPLMLFLAQEIARDEDTSLVLIHHLRKGSGEDIGMAMYRVRGSTAITAFSRSIVAMERNQSGALIQVIKSNLGRIPKPLNIAMEFDSEDRITSIKYAEWTAPPKKTTKTERCVQWVWELLKSSGITPLKEIIDAGVGEGYSRSNIYAARDVLLNQIVVSGTGREAFWEIAVDESTFSNISNHLGEKNE